MRQKELQEAAELASREGASILTDLDQRSREIFRQIVQSYISTGDPAGSRNISRALPMTLSPASVRNIMSDLEELGLIYAPHTSAGRLPTETGLRLFVDALLEIGDLSGAERAHIKSQLSGSAGERDLEDVLSDTGEMLSGLANCAGVILTDKQTKRLKQIEFVALEPNKTLAVLVAEDGSIENRIVNLPEGMPASVLVRAANYLNARIAGKTLADARQQIEAELASRKAELDELTAKMVRQGLATWSGADDGSKNLIVRGRSHLLDDLTALDDLERIRKLFDDLEAKQDLIEVLTHAERADGVRIFIGSENQLFSLSGSSMVVAPFKDSDRNIVGVLGVIGPTRLNYARIIPMVDYTAKLIGHMLP
jgi:heat-inducible transcriptional repressor